MQKKKDECITHLTFLSIFFIVFIPTGTGRTLTGVLFTSGKTDYDKKKKNSHLLTECEGRTGKYSHEVIAVRSEPIKDRTKNDKGPIFPSTARAS